MPIGAVLVALVLAEVGVRLLGEVDLDGNFVVHGRVLKPYHLPVARIRREAQAYRLLNTRTIYDAQLGWGPRPGYVSRDGLYAYDSLGIRVDPRAPAVYGPSPRQGTLRIVLIGDSYTHGEEVPFRETWGHYLEQALRARRINAEVLNLGVGGYGVDQAYLRWQTLGRGLSPHVVILGLPMEDCQRDVNILRPLKVLPGGLPFSKPRFVLSGTGGDLRLINQPAIDPAHVVAALEHLAAWDLLPYEGAYRPADYEDRLWLRSRLLGLGLELVAPVEDHRDSYDLRREAARVTLGILEACRIDIEARGARFLLVHLPSVVDLVRLRLHRSLVYADLLDAIAARHHLIRCDAALLRTGGYFSLSSLFMSKGHYTARASEAIAREIGDDLARREGWAVTAGSLPR